MYVLFFYFNLGHSDVSNCRHITASQRCWLLDKDWGGPHGILHLRSTAMRSGWMLVVVVVGFKIAMRLRSGTGSPQAGRASSAPAR